MRQPSPSASARVRSAPASEPASGSVSANAPICSPRASGGTKRARCSSVPNASSGSVAALVCTATVTPTPASPRDSSSSTRMYERKSAPAPPYSSGTHVPISPSSASFANTSRGKRCSRSHAAACGSISCRANSRASAWISRCSGLELEIHAADYSQGLVRQAMALGAVLVVAAAGSGAASATPAAASPPGSCGPGARRSTRTATRTRRRCSPRTREIIEGTVDVRLTTHKLAVAFNASLPCAGQIVALEVKRDAALATFVLGHRPATRATARATRPRRCSSSATGRSCLGARRRARSRRRSRRARRPSTCRSRGRSCGRGGRPGRTGGEAGTARTSGRRDRGGAPP